MVHRQRLRGLYRAAVHAPVSVAREDLLPRHVTPDEFNTRRFMLDKARRQVMDFLAEDLEEPTPAVPPRLTATAIQALRMPRSRDKVLANLEQMYTEAFARAKESGDANQMQMLDFAYRREQLYFEILLDIRDGMSTRS